MEESEEAGTRYEIHIQNEDGSSTGEVIVVYSNEGNDPAQVQDLVSKALAQVAQQQGQVQQEVSSMVIEDPNATVQTQYYETTHILTQDEAKAHEHLQVQVKAEEEQQIYLTQEVEESKPEVLATLKPEQLELVMTQVENEFTEKAVPYKLKAVEPEELEDMKRSLNLRRRQRLYGPAFPPETKEDEVATEESKEEEKGEESVEVIETQADGGEDIIPVESVKVEEVTPEPDQEESPAPVSLSCSYEDCDHVAESELDHQRHLKAFHGDETPFQCSTCAKAFKLELSLKIHLLGHKQIPALNWEVGSKLKRLYDCPICEYRSFYKRPLIQHLRESHQFLPSDLFTCEKCKVVCMSQEDLDQHTKSQIHLESQCTLCSLCGASSKNISQHMRRVHSNEKPYTCSECGYRCKFSGALKAHMLTHRPERAFKCQLCNYCARSKDQLKRHEVVHSTVKDQKCPHCKYATQTIYRLRKHMKIHTNITKGYRCIMCEFVTHDKVLLKQHKIDAHSKKLNLACRECESIFETVQELKIHALAVHKSSHSWFCKYCEFSTATRRELGIHMQTHVGKHRYTCKICGYSCRQSNPFKRHLARHSKVKGFACHMCSYSCTDKYDLEKHLMTHSDAKMVTCPDCSYTCRYKAQLVRHKKLVHDEMKPYFCTFCTYTTKSPQNLKNHMHLHAEKKPHQCVLCDFSACQKSNLKRHMQTHLKKAQIVYVQ